MTDASRFLIIRGAMASAAGLALAAAMPVQAAQVILTFDRGEAACTLADGGPAGTVCAANGQFIGANYGSTSQLAVSYDSSEASGSRTSLQHTIDRFYSGTDGQATSGPAGPELSQIIFTPLAGFEVSFTRFTWDKLSATSAELFEFEVRDSAGNLLFESGPSVPRTIDVGTGYYTGPVTFLFGNGGRGAVAVDDVIVDVRAVGLVGGIPEPSTWAMMILGFGAVGGALRRRKAHTKVSFA